MPLAIGQGHQDMQDRWRQRRFAVRVLHHIRLYPLRIYESSGETDIETEMIKALEGHRVRHANAFRR